MVSMAPRSRSQVACLHGRKASATRERGSRLATARIAATAKGNVRGAMEGTSSLAGGAASIMMMAGMTGPAAPILAGVGIALALLPSIMGDPKKKRQDELAREASSRAYAMPSGADYSMDASGRYDDYDYRGRNRPVNVVNNVYAMDSTSFRDFLIANPTALSAGLTSAIAGGNADDVVGSLQARA